MNEDSSNEDEEKDTDDSEYGVVGENLDRFVEENNLKVERTERAEQILSQLKQNNQPSTFEDSIAANLNDDDWEEVDD
jgi:hypothetical protein